jgi:hypothetical protein
MGLLMVHRVGVMRPGEPIVSSSAAAQAPPRRDPGDRLRDGPPEVDAWFWKREKRAGEWHWVDPRAEDHADLARWTNIQEFDRSQSRRAIAARPVGTDRSDPMAERLTRQLVAEKAMSSTSAALRHADHGRPQLRAAGRALRRTAAVLSARSSAVMAVGFGNPALIVPTGDHRRVHRDGLRGAGDVDADEARTSAAADELEPLPGDRDHDRLRPQHAAPRRPGADPAGADPAVGFAVVTIAAVVR